MGCLSSVLRQLMVFEADLQRFVNSLTQQLGPQLQNVPLLYQGAPELRYILNLFSVELDSPKESLSSIELRARFQSLVADVFSVLAETRLFALFLDDLHEADESCVNTSYFCSSQLRKP
jgi:predicted ATPase